MAKARVQGGCGASAARPLWPRRFPPALVLAAESRACRAGALPVGMPSRCTRPSIARGEGGCCRLSRGSAGCPQCHTAGRGAWAERVARCRSPFARHGGMFSSIPRLINRLRLEERVPPGGERLAQYDPALVLWLFCRIEGDTSSGVLGLPLHSVR